MSHRRGTGWRGVRAAGGCGGAGSAAELACDPPSDMMSFDPMLLAAPGWDSSAAWPPTPPPDGGIGLSLIIQSNGSPSSPSGADPLQ